MKNAKRILIPLFLSILVLTLLLLAGCGGGKQDNAAVTQQTTEEEKDKGIRPDETFEFLTEEELQTGETPILLLPEEEPTTQSFTIKGDGETATFTLGRGTDHPSAVTKVTVNGTEVSDFEYNQETGEITLKEPPAKDTEVKVEAEKKITPPASTDAAPAQEPAGDPEPDDSDAPTWSGAPETPIIPYRPQEESDN